MFNSLFSKISLLFVFVCAASPIFAPKKGGHSPGKSSRRSPKEAGSPATSPTSAFWTSPDELPPSDQITYFEKQLARKDLTAAARTRIEGNIRRLKDIPPLTLE